MYSTPLAGTPRRNRRGDIHSNFSSPLLRRTAAAAATGDPGSEGGLLIPNSSAPVLSNAPVQSDGPEVTRVLWGTSVNVNESLVAFMDFLKKYKVKYRRAHDRSRGQAGPQVLNPQQDERKLYVDYLRKMRITEQTTLNLDATNLLAYPGTEKLYHALIKYPQEIIPIMDIGLKEAMLSLAEEDEAEGMDDTDWEAERAFIEDHAYRIRPFGGEIVVNMRTLNPSG